MEEKTSYTHHLLCTKCGEKFSIDIPEQNNTKLNLDKRFCPGCGNKGKISLNPAMFPSSGQPSLSQRRHWNEEFSKVSMQAAAEQQARDEQSGANKTITVNDPSGKGLSFQVPEKVLKSIDERITPEIEKMID